MNKDLRASIRYALENLSVWKRQERMDTIITARKNGLTVREAAAAAGCSYRHAKRLIAQAGLVGMGRSPKYEPPKADPLPEYESPWMKRKAPGAAVPPRGTPATVPASPPEVVASPQNAPPVERYEDEQRRVELARMERQRVKPVQMAPDPCSATERVLPVYEPVVVSGDVEAAVDAATRSGPAGIIFSATEPPGESGEIRRFGIEAERLLKKCSGQAPADADGRPAPGGWRFPSLSELRLK